MSPEWYRLFQSAFTDITSLTGAQGTANTMPGNNTGSAAADVRLTAAQVKTFLAIAQSDVSGLVAALALKTIEATAAEYRAKTAGVIALTPTNVWDAAAYVALTDAASISVDMSAGFNFSVTIAGNRTIANPSNPKVGQSGCFKVTASGGTRTIDFGTQYLTTLTLPISISSGQTCYIYYFVDTSTRIIITAAINNPA